MALAERIKWLRQQKGWSQADLATKLKINQKQISGYECGLHIPSTELLIRMAEVFNVSLDYLAFDDRNYTISAEVIDTELLQRFQQLNKLSEKDRNLLKSLIDVFLLKSRFQQLATSEQGLDIS
jgi:transcriptional regulator with XRE-family HTH domain